MNLLDVVPAHWTKASVGKYCDVQLGKMLQSDPSSEKDELKRYLRAINIAKHGLDIGHEFSMWIKPQEMERFRLRRGDILVSEGGDAGRTAVFDCDEEFYFQNAINRVRPVGNAKILPEFIYYWFTFLKVAGYVEMVCNVATIAHFTAEKVKAAPLALPPLETQRRIAQFLDEKTARIDGLIEKKRALLDRLAEKRQALITRAVTRGISDLFHDKDDDTESAETLERGIWESWKLAHAYPRIGSGTTPTSTSDHYYSTEGGTPWITTAELRENYIGKTASNVTNDALREYSTLRVYKPGSLFIAMYGATIGRLGISTVPATCNQACCVFEESKVLDNRFLFYWLWHRRADLISLSVGGGQPNLSQQDLREERAYCPPLKIQRRIVQFLDEMNAGMDKQEEGIERSIALLNEYRSALITAAVTGEIGGLQ